MVSERIIPDDPLAFIQRCVRARQVLWTYHVQMRLQGRTLSREALLRSVEEGMVHIHIATDVAGDNIRIVTAYRPSLHGWEPDLRTRRTQQ